MSVLFLQATEKKTNFSLDKRYVELYFDSPRPSTSSHRRRSKSNDNPRHSSPSPSKSIDNQNNRSPSRSIPLFLLRD